MALPAAAAPTLPWLDVPATWSRHVEGGVVSLMPGDLPEGASLLLMVEPPKASQAKPGEAYAQALRDLGPWEPIGEPGEARAGGWTYRQGVGLATLNGARLIGHTAVVLRAGQLVRVWVLADSDRTYNRYKAAITTALESVQDIGKPAPAPTAAPPQAGTGAPAGPGRLPPGFGAGVSGVYVGLDRGAAAAVGVGGSPRSEIADALEAEVLYPDGSLRRRLPLRGLMSDPAWDRGQQPALWGRWQQQGRQIGVERGGHRTAYTVQGLDLVSDRGRLWTRLPVHGDTRLAGTWARADARRADMPRLTLSPDGRYEDHGGFLRMVGSPWHLVVPDGDAMLARWSDAQAVQALGASRGRYRFEAFTLTLHADDGRVWQINAYLPPGQAAPRPALLVINGRALRRDGS